MYDRETAVVLASRALLDHRGEEPMDNGSSAPVMRAVREAEVVLDAVEPLFGTDERAEQLEARLLYIHKCVEHSRNMAQKFIDSQRDVPGSFAAFDVGRREALDDVLALFETEAYQKRVGSNE